MAINKGVMYANSVILDHDRDLKTKNRKKDGNFCIKKFINLLKTQN